MAISEPLSLFPIWYAQTSRPRGEKGGELGNVNAVVTRSGKKEWTRPVFASWSVCRPPVLVAGYLNAVIVMKHF